MTYISFNIKTVMDNTKHLVIAITDNAKVVIVKAETSIKETTFEKETSKDESVKKDESKKNGYYRRGAFKNGI